MRSSVKQSRKETTVIRLPHLCHVFVKLLLLAPLAIILNFSEPTIATPTVNVYTVDPLVINCVINKIAGQRTITWTSQTAGIGSLSIAQGSYVPASKSQTSTLTISKAQLKTLKDTDKNAHVFTCEYKVTSGVTLTATQTATLFTPGWIKFFHQRVRLNLSENIYHVQEGPVKRGAW